MHMHSPMCCNYRAVQHSTKVQIHTLLLLPYCRLAVTPPAELTSNNSASMFAVTLGVELPSTMNSPRPSFSALAAQVALQSSQTAELPQGQTGREQQSRTSLCMALSVLANLT